MGFAGGGVVPVPVGLLLLLALTPSTALALPGPEVLVPVAAVVVQVLILVAWLGGRLLRQLQRSRWRWAVLAAIGLLFTLNANIIVACIAMALAAAAGARSWAWRGGWLALVFTVLYGVSLVAPNGTPPSLSAFDAAQQPVGPLPRAQLEVLRAGPAHLVHLGEPEAFANCRAPVGSLLRPADLEVTAPSLYALDAPVILLVAMDDRVEPTRHALGNRTGVHVASFDEVFPDPRQNGSLCYSPPLSLLYSTLVPKAIINGVQPAAPLELGDAPLLRPADVHWLLAERPEIRQISASEVVQTPTVRLDDWRGAPAVVVASHPLDLAAAARLLTSQGVELIALSRGEAPETSRDPSELSLAALAGWGLLAAMLAALAGALCRHLAWRSDVRHAASSRRVGPVLRVVAEVLSLTACLAVAWHLDGFAVPPALAVWITPTMAGPAALGFCMAWLGLVAVALWVRVADHSGRYRLGAAVGTVVFLLQCALGVIEGPHPLPLHLYVVAIGLGGGWLLERGGLWWAKRRTANRAGRAPSWALLEWIEGVASAGNKARQLAARRREGLPVPPGIVVWTDREGRAAEASIRAVGRLMRQTPLLVRSTSMAEDTLQATAAGRFASVACDIGELQNAITTVIRSYGEVSGPLPAVLVMPRVDCTLAGVVQDPGLGPDSLLVEEAPGYDTVTSGKGGRQRHLGRHSHRWLGDDPVGSEQRALAQLMDALPPGPPRYLEWLAREGHVWLVQERPVPGEAPEAPNPLSTLLLSEAPPDPSRPWLLRAPVDGLPPLAPVAATQLWADCWRRDHALGDAFSLLGLPRLLAPERVVLPAWGALWSLTDQVEVMMRALQLRVLLPASIPGLAADRIASGLARRAAREPKTFREAVASSIALRLLDPYLPSTHADPPPMAPTIALANALRDVPSPAELPVRWLHRATWDLDPSCPRYGERTDPSWTPPDRPPAWEDHDLPVIVDQRWCALLRDRLHDRLTWEIARLRTAEPHWREAEPHAGATPSTDRLTVLDVESVGLPFDRPDLPGGGTWVSGSGPIEGTATSDPTNPAPDHILVIDTPTAELAACFAGFGGVVASRGGFLSHAALVAREDGVPALFGTGNAALHGEGRLRLEEGGTVRWLTG